MIKKKNIRVYAQDILLFIIIVGTTIGFSYFLYYQKIEKNIALLEKKSFIKQIKTFIQTDVENLRNRVNEIFIDFFIIICFALLCGFLSFSNVYSLLAFCILTTLAYAGFFYIAIQGFLQKPPAISFLPKIERLYAAFLHMATVAFVLLMLYAFCCMLALAIKSDGG